MTDIFLNFRTFIVVKILLYIENSAYTPSYYYSSISLTEIVYKLHWLFSFYNKNNFSNLIVVEKPFKSEK